ncbi:MAG TPA: hypothetical protein VMU94_14150 [Streptosporangiaceae bacterium]|nr:hypothetical protein [Streptosporangiaceae bacterium]
MTDEQPQFQVTPAALEYIGNLLEAAYIHGIGITFEPDFVGWKVGYISGRTGGDLATAYDLETAVKAAEKPLDELAHRLAANRRSK